MYSRANLGGVERCAERRVAEHEALLRAVAALLLRLAEHGHGMGLSHRSQSER
jgi:hypothetical protein